MNPFRYLLKVGIAALALIPAVLSAQQVATKFLVTEAGGSDPLGTTSWISGVTSTIRITALDDGDQLVAGYARDVTVTLPDPYTNSSSWVSVTVPASSFVSGRADGIAITPMHAGTGNRRIAVTDGNIATYNANNNQFFSISPASFFAARAGSYRGLSRNIVVAGSNLTRIIALNDDFSIAEAYTGTVTISSPDLDSDVDADISFGGVAEDVSISFTTDGAGQSIDITDGVTTTLGASSVGGAGVIDVRPLDSTGGIAAALNVSTTGSVLRPGGNMNVSFELKATAAAPIDSTDPIGTLSTVTLFNSNYSITYYANSSVTTPGSGATNGSRGSVVFTVPDYFAPGAYTLRINTGLVGANTDTSITIGGAPDLAIQRFDYAPGSYEAGEAIRFDMVWRNLRITTPDDGLNSRVPASQRYRTELHLSTDDTFGNSDDILVWVYLTAGNDQGSDLLPGQAVSLSGEFTLPENLPGTYYLLAKVNSQGGRGATADVSFSAGFTEVVGPTPPSVLTDGNNIILPSETQKLTIVPRTSTETTRLSLTADGSSAQGNSDLPSIATDASYVAFQSLAPLAGAGTSNAFSQIFRKNPSTGSVELVSVGTNGLAANGASGRPSISADGRYVVFESTATNLQPGDTNGFSDIYLRDMQLGVTRRLSIQGLTQANSGSFKPSISANGRFIAFTSTARNLAAGTSAGLSQVYIYDRDVSSSGIYDTTGNTSLSLVTQIAGTAGFASSINARISANGNYVVFSTKASNLLGGVSSTSQIVRWDRVGGNFVIASANAGARADGDADFPAINADGSKIAFVSRALNLTADSAISGVPHIFRATISSGLVTQLIRVNGAGNVEPNNPVTGAIASPDLGSFEPSISSDGNSIAFASESNNLLPSIPVRNIDRTYYNSSSVYNFSDQNGVADVYLADVSNPADPIVKRASVSSFGYEATIVTTGTTFTLRVPASRAPAISPDGRYVVFASDAEGHNGLSFGATNFDYGDTNGSRDIYLFDRKSDLGTPSNLPVASLLPVLLTEITAGQSITFLANASSSVRAISSVEFYANGSLIGSVAAPSSENVNRYSLQWTAPSPGAGNNNTYVYEIAAMAVDSSGLRSPLSAAERITVKQLVGISPTVTITYPTQTTSGNSTTTAVPFAISNGSSLPIVARVIQGTSPISTVKFYASSLSNGTLTLGSATNVGTGLYSLNYTTSLAIGAYDLFALVTDAAGNIIQSNSTRLSITAATPGTPPTGSLVFPSAGSVQTLGQRLSLQAVASDLDSSIASVAFFANGVLVDTDTTAPFTGTWTPTVGGNYNLVLLITDAQGATTVTAPVSVSVISALPPSITLAAPAPGSISVGQSTVLSATAVPGSGASIAQVEFFANGVSLGVDQQSPFTVTFTPSADGIYTLGAVVTDNFGTTTLSNARSLTVIPVVGLAPTVTVQAPTVALTTASVYPFRATATDSDGTIASVEFFINGSAIGFGNYDSLSSTWIASNTNFSSLGAGVYTVTAIATDNSGNRSSSAPLSVTVTASNVDGAFGAALNEIFYSAVGRNATDAEQLAYFAQFGSGAADYEIAAALMQTSAFDSTGAIVISAYQAVFGEYPNFVTYQNGLQFINNGGTTASYIDALYASGEYLAKFGALPSFATAINVERFAVTVHSNLTGVIPSAKIKGTALTAADLNLTAAQLADARKNGSSERSIIVARFSRLGTDTTGSVVASYILSLTGTTQVPAALLKRSRVAGVILALNEPDTAISLRETSALSTYDLLDVAELYGTGTTDAAIKPIFRQLPTSTSVSLGSELKFTAIVISPASVAGDITSNWTFNRTTTLGFGTAVSSQTPVHTFTYTVAAANTGNAGTYGLSVSNRSGTTAAPAFTASITPIVPASLPGVVTLQVGVFYSVDLGADVAGMSYVAKKLPKGLVLNAATGVISGVPTKTGSFTVEYNTVIGKLSSVKKRTTFVVGN